MPHHSFKEGTFLNIQPEVIELVDHQFKQRRASISQHPLSEEENDGKNVCIREVFRFFSFLAFSTDPARRERQAPQSGSSPTRSQALLPRRPRRMLPAGGAAPTRNTARWPHAGPRRAERVGAAVAAGPGVVLLRGLGVQPVHPP